MQSSEKITTNNSLEKKVDEESCKGRFGWCELEKNHVPYIFRNVNKEKYISVRMAEQKFLNRYLSVLPTEAITCYAIHSFYITEAESRLLNDINVNHTGYYFGKANFNGKDLIVRSVDATEFHRYLVLCYNRIVKKQCSPNDRCGFVRIGGESVVPFTVHDAKQYVPLFYFEEVTEHLQIKSVQIDGWDLAYLKLCCKVQGIRQTLFESDRCKVVSLDQIKNYFPPGTSFEDYWPAKDPWQATAKNFTSASWTIKPSSEPNSSPNQQQSNSNEEAFARLLESSNNTTPPSSNPSSQTQQTAKIQPQRKTASKENSQINQPQPSAQNGLSRQNNKNNNNNSDKNRRQRS
jgi:hypothetical protein